jgi:hypothetical protein
MIKTLDLHDVRHNEVDRLVENFILLEKIPLRIITGNSEKMVGLVTKVLKRHDFNYESFIPGQITILGE